MFKFANISNYNWLHNLYHEHKRNNRFTSAKITCGNCKTDIKSRSDLLFHCMFIQSCEDKHKHITITKEHLFKTITQLINFEVGATTEDGRTTNPNLNTYIIRTKDLDKWVQSYITAFNKQNKGYIIALDTLFETTYAFTLTKQPFQVKLTSANQSTIITDEEYFNQMDMFIKNQAHIIDYLHDLFKMPFGDINGIKPMVAPTPISTHTHIQNELIQLAKASGTKWDCSICKGDIDFDNITITPCGHKYCKTCLDSWLSIRKICPTCNQSL